MFVSVFLRVEKDQKGVALEKVRGRSYAHVIDDEGLHHHVSCCAIHQYPIHACSNHRRTSGVSQVRVDIFMY